MKYNLRDCLEMEIDEFDLPRISNPIGELYYQDNGCNVLGVAHLDYVKKSKPRKCKQYVMCPQLDDRLGVWILLNRLPAMGINLDILLTDKEEECSTTANCFFPDKQYNWVIEFDRAGDDIVFYQYEDFADYWPIVEGTGSFSDISELEQLGVLCANIGIGYYCQHTYDCYADLSITSKQVKNFAKFYHKNKDTRFAYVLPKYESIYSINEESYCSNNEYLRNKKTRNWERIKDYFLDTDYRRQENSSGEDFMDQLERENQKCENAYWKSKRKGKRKIKCV